MLLSMAVNSLPSILKAFLPEPPKMISTSIKMIFDSTMIKALPRRGSSLNRCMLVGTGIDFRNSPNLIISVDMALTLVTLRSNEDRVVRNIRANFSLVISNVGMRPRMILSWLVRS